MVFLKKLLAIYTFAVGIAAPLPVSAGLIILAGDSNFAAAVLTTAGNQQFFKNVLGSGKDVVVQSTNLSVADTAVNIFYSGLGGGVSSTLVSGPITAAALTGAELFVSIVPHAAYLAAEVAAISGFLSAGGTMFLFGENINFVTQNGFLNALLADLGSTMSIVSGSVSNANAVTDSLTTGVVSAAFSVGSPVSGGTPLFTTGVGANRRVVVAKEQLETRQVPVAATFSLIGISLVAMAAVHRRRVESESVAGAKRIS